MEEKKISVDELFCWFRPSFCGLFFQLCVKIQDFIFGFSHPLFADLICMYNVRQNRYCSRMHGVFRLDE